MTQQDHLQVYDLSLTLRSPLFVGDGRVCMKKGYLFNRQADTVSFLHEERFVSALVRKRCIDQYERFILGSSGNLYGFLRQDCGFSRQELDDVISYTISAENLSDTEHLREIHTFLRDSRNRVYVPGSSVKGALRTVLLTERILKQGGYRPKYTPEGELIPEKEIPESRYLHTLRFENARGQRIAESNAVNSVLRGLSISDSPPVSDEEMILCGKVDLKPDGTENDLPLYRECIRPGAVLRFRLTLDQSILKGSITPETLLESIRVWAGYYQQTYCARFPLPEYAMELNLERCILLGGGVGYFSKTVTYPYYGKDALAQAIRALNGQRAFQKHHHEWDRQYGISPRTQKWTEYERVLYPYGVCEVSLR